MSEESNSDAKGELIKASVEVIKTAYNDALRPLAKETGKALKTVGRTVNVVLSPLTGFVWSYEQFQKWLESKVASRLEGTAEEEIITPKASVAVPAIEAVRYCGDEEDLSDLFASLLATSMTRSKAHLAHPAFVGIIKSLSSDEARLIKYFKKHQSWASVDVRTRIDVTPIKSKLPDRVAIPKVNASFSVFARNLSLCGINAGCDHPKNTPAYIDNLERLGVIRFADDHILTNPLYKELENSDLVKSTMERAKQGRFSTPFLKRKKFDVTEFGFQLIQACHKD